MSRQHLTGDVHVLLNRGDNILLLKRANTGYEDGKYHLPAGHKELGETISNATVREAKEEIGVDIDPKDLRLLHIMHNNSNNERIGFFFEVSRWQGEPCNMEPNKCSELKWVNKNNLPENMVAYGKEAILRSNQGIVYSEFGWDK